MAEYVWIDAVGGVRSKSRVRNNLYLPYLHRIADGAITRCLVVMVPAIPHPHKDTHTYTHTRCFCPAPLPGYPISSVLALPMAQSGRVVWPVSGCPLQWLCSAVASAPDLWFRPQPGPRRLLPGIKNASPRTRPRLPGGITSLERWRLSAVFCRLLLLSGRPRDSAFTLHPTNDATQPSGCCCHATKVSRAVEHDFPGTAPRGTCLSSRFCF